MQDLCKSVPDAIKVPVANNMEEMFDPYPNENSFLSGDWYWNHGAQKSQKSFKELINIVASPKFKPEDVHDTCWSAINKTLGLADFDDKGEG